LIARLTSSIVSDRVKPSLHRDDDLAGALLDGDEVEDAGDARVLGAVSGTAAAISGSAASPTISDLTSMARNRATPIRTTPMLRLPTRPRSGSPVMAGEGEGDQREARPSTAAEFSPNTTTRSESLLSLRKRKKGRPLRRLLSSTMFL
jgi:hypothetical protein